jgi:hypothetical protein
VNKSKRSNLAIGILLILVGGVFLALQLAPGLSESFCQSLIGPFSSLGLGFVC